MSNPTRAFTEGIFITVPLQLVAGKLVLGPPVARAAAAVLGANILRAKTGRGAYTRQA